MALNRRFRELCPLRAEPKISDFIPNKVSNLKMEIGDTEKILLTPELRIQVMMKLEKLMKWTVFLQVHPDVVRKI